MKKRLFIPLLALCTTLALLTVFISAEEPPPTSGACGPSATWSYDQESKTLTISGNGDVITQKWDNNVHAYSYYVPWRDEVEVVEFEGADFSSLKDQAFYNWSNLSSITLPDGMTSIGRQAFEGCASLVSVIIPEGVTEIGWHSFDGCTNLASVTIPDSVTSIEAGAFCKCSKLADITIPEGVSSIVMDTFEDCSSLTSVTLPSTIIGIDESAFWRCSSLTSITIPQSVTNIAYGAFLGCSSLTSITIPEGMTQISESTFANCSKLTSVTIPKNVSKIDLNAFSGCTSLTEIKIAPDNTNYILVDGVLFNRAKDTLVLYPAGKQETSYSIPNGVSSIGVSAFSGCMGLTNVFIPEGVTNIGGSAFSYCTGLTSVSIPEGVTNISDDTFWRCTNLTDITIPKSVESIGNNAFWGCTNLTDITIPKGVESIGSNAFCDCSKLASVTIPESVTYIHFFAFRRCSKLTSVTITQNVRYLGFGVFSDCASLTEIRTDPDNTDYVSVDGVLFGRKNNTLVAFPAGRQGAYSIPDYVYSIYDDAFAECTGLTSVSIPNSVTSIGRRLFAGCTGLTSVTIPESVTSIEYQALEDCSNLVSVTIPKSVSTIGNFFFDDCIGLTDVYYGGSKKQWLNAGGPEQINNGTTIIHFALTDVCTVTYDANGGTGEMPDVRMQDSETLTLPACGFTVPVNQKFKIWSIANVEYAPGSTYVITCDTTVKALWEKDGEPVPPDDETYAITVSETITNGKVETNVKEAAAGTTVTVTATPNPGYKVGEITVTKSDGSKVPVTNGAFQMPAGNVTVSASFTASATSKLSAVWRANEENILKGELVIQGTSAEKWYLIEMKKADTESSLTNSVFFTLRGDESGTLIVQCENGVTLNMYEMDGNKISDFANSHQFVQDQTADGPLEIL